MVLRRLVSFGMCLWMCACSSSSTPAATGDASTGDGSAHCTGVCGAPSGAVCASRFASTDCLQGMCCVLAADSGPPFYDDAGSCPGSCASPDDIGCSSWFRTSACAVGDLCCVLQGPTGDAGSD